MRTKYYFPIIFITLLTILLKACQTRWQLDILINEELAISIEPKAYYGLHAEPDRTGGNHGPLTKASMIIPIIFLEK